MALTVNYLVVGGGGGTTWGYQYRGPGGGGAGAMKEGTASLTGAVAITIGAGGAPVTDVNLAGNNGGNSTIAGVVTALGGGGGGCGQTIGGQAQRSGGCGGGCGDWGGAGGAGGAATDGGYRGGNNSASAGSGGAGGGGGGMGGPGTDCVFDTNRFGPCAGGPGKASSISGASVVYAAGGASPYFESIVGPVNGAANTGNGGTGGIYASGGSGAAGGSGVVIIDYAGTTPLASGGTITTVGGRTQHKFTASGTFTVLAVAGELTYLCVAGGGGTAFASGSYRGSGGGGAGRVKTGVFDKPSAPVAITVGAGGTPSANASTNGNNGGDSIIAGVVTSKGGGGGGCGNVAIAGNDGGCGGGTGDAAGAGIFGGNATDGGGNGGQSSGSTSSGGSGGGGGGNAGSGGAGAPAGGRTAGGAGIASVISGASVVYGAGGSGGDYYPGSTTAALAGAPNTGNGAMGPGGNSSGAGKAGGSGIVILSYDGLIQLGTGGTVTQVGGRTIHTFTASGTYIPIEPLTVDYLVVGGGGGGGNANQTASGGGGGGAARTGSTTLMGTATVAVTIGAGGAPLTKGSDSAFGGVTAEGGGFGATYNGAGGNGGCGGGGCYTGAVGIGSVGGNGGVPSTSGATGCGGGGGMGGAGGAGGPGGGGQGAPGLSSSISGAAVSYAGGGGAGSTYGDSGYGQGGGGNAWPYAPQAGAANRGGGGGGAGYDGASHGGAAGGSGVVIVRYAGTPRATGGTITQGGGFTVHTFNASGTFSIQSTTPTLAVDVLVVGGGGSGGEVIGGGGGGGQVLQSTGVEFPLNTVSTISAIGAGGATAGAPDGSYSPGNPGGGTTLTSTNGYNVGVAGGGAGSSFNVAAAAGYNGGGNGAAVATPAGTNRSGGLGDGANGGGGGASQIANGGNAGVIAGNAGAGATGVTFNGVVYGSGGGGGARDPQWLRGVGGDGAGNGGGPGNTTHGSPAVANRGGGGGGGAFVSVVGTEGQGGAGGSGVVIFRYLAAAGMATGGTITTSGPYRLHTFTAPGAFTVTTVLPSITAITNVGGGAPKVFLGLKMRVVLTGANYMGGATVNVSGGITVSNVVVVSTTQITADFTGTAVGAWDVSVTTPVGTSATVPYTVSAVTALPGAGLLANQVLAPTINWFPGGAGFHFVVGNANRIVTHLGRWKFAGNNRKHTIWLRSYPSWQIVASAVVDMATGAADSWVYTLISPVTLQAGQNYVLTDMSCASGGDLFADASHVAVANTADAAVFGLQWDISSMYSFVPGANRADSYSVGYRFTASAAYNVLGLGRWKNPGNNLAHRVVLKDAAGAILRSAIVDFTGGKGLDNQFNYAPIATPYVLTAGATYYVLVEEPGGDVWTDHPNAITPWGGLSITAAVAEAYPSPNNTIPGTLMVQANTMWSAPDVLCWANGPANYPEAYGVPNLQWLAAGGQPMALII